VALFGRKINAAEHQLTFVSLLRAVADEQLSPTDAVRHYHEQLASLRITPLRTLQDDLQRTQTAFAYRG
jgi:hypothetical protein